MLLLLKALVIAGGVSISTHPDPGPVKPECDTDYIQFLLESGVKPCEIKLICWEE